ncbi:hypothetical protein D9D60_22580 [Escherichia coli]|nr:hypothetical protein [Escherichia coli]
MARAFFCSKVTGAPPFHDVNVTQLIVIDYYHAVISGQPLYGHFCAVCNTRRIYTFPHWLSTS